VKKFVLHKIFRGHCLWVAIGLNLLFLHPILFSGKTLFVRDIHRLFYPMKSFLTAALKSGSMPFWCSSIFCGSPFMSDMQAGVFYPPSLLFILLPLPWSFNVYVALHVFLALCFFYLFIKGMGLSKEAALLTSVSYGFGSYVISSVNLLNNLSTLIWLPAVLWSFERARKKGSPSTYLLTVLFLSLGILGAEPQLFLLTVSVFFLYACIGTSQTPSLSASFVRRSAVPLVLILFAVTLTAVQWGPTFGDYQLSIRSGGLSYEEASRHSLHLGMLKHLMVPLHFPADFATDPASFDGFFPGKETLPWLLSPYPGMVIAPLALLGLLAGFSERKVFWFVTFLVTLVLALGNTTPVYRIFYRICPFFRFPDKFFFLSSFSLLVLAAYGLDRLRTFAASKGIPMGALTLTLTGLLIADLYVNHRHLNPYWDASFYQMHHTALRPILDDTETFRIHVDPAVLTRPPSPEQSIAHYHIQWQMMLAPNLGSLHGLDHVGGALGLELRYQHLITELLLEPWASKIRFLRLANTKYIITHEELHRTEALKNCVERVNGLVYKIKDTCPRAWLVGELHFLNKGTGHELINGSFEPRTTALSNSAVAADYSTPFFRKVDDITYLESGQIHIELFAEKPSILVLSESSYPGWRVFVDGKERECLWLNLLFQGVAVEAGKHEVEFVFIPKHFGFFAWVSLVSLVFFVFICTRAVFAARKKTYPERNAYP
jgi:hypothetical protein